MRLNKRAVCTVLGLATFLVVLVGVAGPALADLSLSSPLNTSGATHEQSAILLSQKAFPSGAATVVVTASDSYAFSLSAGVLAKAYDAPLLLTASSALGSDVAAELTRLKPTQVFLVGLSSTLVTSVRSAVAGLPASQVVVLKGADGYATAALVAAAVKSKVGTVDRVVIVPGDSYAAGIAASPLASAQAWPILLTPAAGPFPQTSANAITSLGATSGIIVGTNVTPTCERLHGHQADHWDDEHERPRRPLRRLRQVSRLRCLARLAQLCARRHHVRRRLPRSRGHRPLSGPG